VRSSTNSFTQAITGLTLTAKGVSTDPVDITVSSSTSNIEKNLQLFVDQYNKVRDKIDKETSFNADTKTTGQLFGATEVLRVEQTLARFVQQRTFASGKVQSLEQLGVSLDEKGKLSLDKSKLEKITSSNLSDVQDFLTKKKTGFAARAQVVLESLVGEKNSVLVSRSQALQRTIDTSSKRSEVLSTRLDKERERLSNQFYALESNLAKIRNNGSAINQLGASSTTKA
jgi:flagellar hook-associated protein 2